MNDTDSAEIISLLIEAEQARTRIGIWKAFEDLGRALDEVATQASENDKGDYDE